MDEDLIDLRGLSCPITTMRLKKFLKTMKPLDRVKVLVDDDEARVDFPPVIEKSDCKMIRQEADGYDSYSIIKN